MAADAPMISSIAVLDTSVMLKWFRQQEPLAAEALALRERYVDGRLAIMIPDLVACELSNVLCFKRDLSLPQIQDAVQTLFDMGLEWVAPTSAVTRRAVEIARTQHTTVYDAIFVATAEDLGAAFITADVRLVGQLAEFPFVQSLGGLPDAHLD